MTDYDITELEETMCTVLIEGGVSNAVYTNRPKASTDGLQNFVVVSVVGDVRDRATYGECKMRVYLFAKDVSSFKNKQKLKVMYDAFRACYPVSIGRYSFGQNPVVSSDVPDNYGYHSRIINFNVTLKSKDDVTHGEKVTFDSNHLVFNTTQ